MNNHDDTPGCKDPWNLALNLMVSLWQGHRQHEPGGKRHLEVDVLGSKPSPPLNDHVTLGESLSFSVPQFPHL